jgi:photosystem II stability/assembly factor-like uncharacterized protein
MNMRKRLLVFKTGILRDPVALILLFLSIHGDSVAQDCWQQVGKPGTGSIYSLAINKDGHIFAGTGGSGIFRSPDDGKSWTAVNNGLLLNLTVITALAINSSGHILAGITTSGYMGSGVFRSLDNGDSWTLVTTGLPDLGVFSLAINVLGHVFAGTSRGIIRSMDHGETWTFVNSSPFVAALAINASGHIFAGTDNAGLIRSTDNGETWTSVDAGLGNRKVQTLDFNLSGHIFAGTFLNGVYRSMDNGKSWVQVNSGLTNTLVMKLAINKNGYIFAGTLGGGVFRSRDNGDSWTEVNSGLTNTSHRCLVIDRADYIFVGSDGDGVFRSTQPTTSIRASTGERPSSFSLEQNYPNPFLSGAKSPALSGRNPSTTIAFSLARSGFVMLKVYDASGQEVAVLIAENLFAGKHEVRWQTNGLAAGVYFYQIIANEFSETRKMVLIR